MHLTDLAQLSDFKLRTQDNKKHHENVIDFCPRFRKKDRVGIVSKNIEDGLFGAGYPILAMVLAYYKLNIHSSYNTYPPYFCFIEEKNGKTSTRIGSTGLQLKKSGGAWQFFDFWPKTRWVPIKPDINNVISSITAKKISRLFWPKNYLKKQIKILKKRDKKNIKCNLETSALESIYIYGEKAGNIRIHVRPKIEKLILRAIKHMPFEDKTKITELIQKRGVLSEKGKYKYYQEFKLISKTEFIKEFY